MSTPDPYSITPAYIQEARPGITVQTLVKAAKLDVTTPGPQEKQTALGAATTTALAGTPTAVGIVWWLSTYGHVSDPVAASAIGASVASVAGYLWRVFQALLGKWGLNPGP